MSYDAANNLMGNRDELVAQVKQLKARIAELEAQVAICSDANNVQADRAKKLRELIVELEKDKARLDWVIQNPVTFHKNWMFSTYFPKDNPIEHRKAIDAAMTPTPEAQQ